jgi:Tfp pilus assembly protein PilO
MREKTILAFIIIAALVAGGVFINGYFNQSAAADELANKVQNETNNLNTITGANQKLNQEIININNQTAQATQDMANESKAIPVKMNSNEIVRKVLDKGKDNAVNVIPLSTEDWSTLKLGKHNYQVFKMTVEVNGDQDKLISFVRDLQGLYDTITIDNASFTKSVTSPTPTAASPTPSETPSPSATPASIVDTSITIGLSIYARA